MNVVKQPISATIANGSVFEWVINGEILQKILTAEVGQKYASKSFKILDLPFVIMVSPKGQNKSDENNFGVFLTLKSCPDDIESITLSKSQSCKQTMSSYTLISRYTQNNKSWGWTSGCLSQSELISMGKDLQSLSLCVRINILKIKMKNGSIFDMNHKINVQKKQQIKWKIDSNQLNLWKKAEIGKPFESEMVNNMWKIRCFPNGVNKDYKGYMSVFIQLCGLPINYKNVQTKISIYFVEIQKEFEYEHDFNYHTSSRGAAKCIQLAECNGHNTLTLVATMEIIDDSEGTAGNDEAEEKEQEMANDAEKDVMNTMKVKIESLTEEIQNRNALILQLQTQQQQNEKRLEEMENVIKAFQSQQMDRNKRMDEEIGGIKSYVFEEKTNDKDNHGQNIANLTTELLSHRQTFDLMRQQIDVIDKKGHENGRKLVSKKEALRKWLRDTVDLEVYFDILVENGYDEMESVQLLTMNELNVMIEKMGHRAKLLRYIAMLNQKQQSVAAPDINVESTAN